MSVAMELISVVWLSILIPFVLPDSWELPENAAVHLQPEQLGLANIFGSPTRPDFRAVRCNPFFQRCSPNSNVNPQRTVANSNVQPQPPYYYPPINQSPSYQPAFYHQPAYIGPPAQNYPQQQGYQQPFPQPNQQPSYYGSQPSSYGSPSYGPQRGYASQPISYGSYGAQPAAPQPVSYGPQQPTQPYQPTSNLPTAPTVPSTAPSVLTSTYGYEYGRISTTTGSSYNQPPTSTLPTTTAVVPLTTTSNLLTTTTAKRRPPLGVDNISATEVVTTPKFEEPMATVKPTPFPPSPSPLTTENFKLELTTTTKITTTTEDITDPPERVTTVKPSRLKSTTPAVPAIQPTGYYIKAIGELWPGSLIRSNDASPSDSGRKSKLSTPDSANQKFSKGIGGDLCLCPCKPSFE